MYIPLLIAVWDGWHEDFNRSLPNREAYGRAGLLFEFPIIIWQHDHVFGEKMKMNIRMSLIITEHDLRQLRLLIDHGQSFGERDLVQWQALEEEIEKAVVVPPDQIPSDVVTMHSRVRIVDMRTGEQLVYQLVYPHEANYAEKKISILAPIGMALLGYPTGTEIEWKVPSGGRRLRIESVEQPRILDKLRAAA